MELATNTKLSSAKNLVRSRKALIAMGCAYFSIAIAVFFGTSTYAGVEILCVAYAIVIIFAFLRGSFMISKKLNSSKIVVIKNSRHLFRNRKKKQSVVLKVTPIDQTVNNTQPSEMHKDNQKIKSSLILLKTSKIKKAKKIRKVIPDNQEGKQSQKKHIDIGKHAVVEEKDELISTVSQLNVSPMQLLHQTVIPIKFQQANDASARKVVLYSRAIAFHCATFSFSAIVAYMLDYPSTKYVYFNSMAICFLNGLLANFWVLLYLSRPESLSTFWRFLLKQQDILVNSLQKRSGNRGNVSRRSIFA